MTGPQDTNGKPPLSDADTPSNSSETMPDMSAASGGPEAKPQEPLGPSGADDSQGAGANQKRGAKVEELMAAHEAEIRDLTDRLLRAHAEMDNMRKRTEREKSDTAKYAVTKFAGDMVGIGDNLQRAIDAAGKPSVENPEMKALMDGVALTLQELSKALERHGVVRIEAQGQRFDPHRHQAVMEQPNPDVPSGTVVQVFQEGYMIGDRVLRPAMVAVAQGGPKAAASEAWGTKPSEAAPEDANSAKNGEPARPEGADQQKSDGTNG